MERVLDNNRISEDDTELSLRPSTLEEYVGQSAIKDNLKVFIKAALERKETLDHVLLYGPPGLGKTTLAHVIAHEMRGNIKVVNGPSIEKSGDLAAILATLSPGDVLFIDEIHRLPRVVEEVLYGAMEDFSISLVVGKDSGARSINIDLPPFTLVGATTRAGDLSSPLRDRFGIVSKLEYYTLEELSAIVKRTSRVFGMSIDEEAKVEVAKRSRGTPRIANRLYRRIRDFATVKGLKEIDMETTISSLNALKVDELGLDDVDLAYLRGIIERFKGGPVGVEAIALAIGEEVTTLEDVYEPYLLQIGMINRTQRGRMATELAYRHLKISYQETLF